jgi:hypothetical protein
MSNSTWNKDCSEIPNLEGFKLRVMLHDNSIIETRVDRNSATGFHTLFGVRIATVRAWMELV